MNTFKATQCRLIAKGYIIRGRFKIAVGYMLLFIGQGLLHLNPIINKANQQVIKDSIVKTPVQKVVGFTIRYLCTAIICWLFLGGRHVAPAERRDWWLQVALSIALTFIFIDGLTWLFRRFKSR